MKISVDSLPNLTNTSYKIKILVVLTYTSLVLHEISHLIMASLLFAKVQEFNIKVVRADTIAGPYYKFEGFVSYRRSWKTRLIASAPLFATFLLAYYNWPVAIILGYYGLWLSKSDVNQILTGKL